MQCGNLPIVLESMTDAYFALDTNWRFTYVNAKAQQLFRKKWDELIGREIWDILEGNREPFFTRYQEAVISGKTDDFEVHILPYNAWAKVRAVPGPEGLQVFFSDIITGDQYELELYQQQLECLVEERTAELRRANERFNTAFNAAPSSMSIHDNQGRIVDVNSSFVKISGWSKEEVIGRTIAELGLCSGEVLSEIISGYRQDGYVHNLEMPFLKKDSQTRIGFFSAEKIVLEGKVHMLALITDVTDIKLMESEMLRLDRLNLVGQMAAGISHEVRNPLTTVRGFLQMLNKKEDCQQYRDYFELMISELDRANSIISEFLSIAKTKQCSNIEADLNIIIKTIEPLLTTDAVAEGKTIALELGNIRQLYLNEKEIRQLLLNLIRNAFEAMPRTGTVKVSTYEEENQVVLAVQDEGTGIPPQILSRLGTPFLTSKTNGTGLGLAVCYGIAERHKAKMEVSTSSSGTTIYIRFAQ